MDTISVNFRHDLAPLVARELIRNEVDFSYTQCKGSASLVTIAVPLDDEAAFNDSIFTAEREYKAGVR